MRALIRLPSPPPGSPPTVLKPIWVIIYGKLRRAFYGNGGGGRLFDGSAFRKAAARIMPTGYTDFAELEAEIGVATMWHSRLRRASPLMAGK